jgi:hypothetical protein
MREFIRPAAAALSIVCLAASIAVLSPDRALAQAKPQMAPAPAAGQPPALKQMALTEKQIEAVLVAQKDMNAITDKLPQDAKPDPKVMAQLEGIAKKNGFAGSDEYNNVLDNINLVEAGIDPATKKYVGSEAVIKAQIAQVQPTRRCPPRTRNRRSTISTWR